MQGMNILFGRLGVHRKILWNTKPWETTNTPGTSQCHKNYKRNGFPAEISKKAANVWAQGGRNRK
jgi:hypothetical protein